MVHIFAKLLTKNDFACTNLYNISIVYHTIKIMSRESMQVFQVKLQLFYECQRLYFK